MAENLTLAICNFPALLQPDSRLFDAKAMVEPLGTASAKLAGKPCGATAETT